MSIELQSWNYLIGMAATVAFAVTAVLAVTDQDIDLFGAIVFGIITAVGGGTIRDVILDVPVCWSTDLAYIWVAVAASIAAYVARPLFTRSQMYLFMLYLDGFGAVLFGIQASGKVWDLGFGIPVAPVILGVITAIGGGLTRDVLANRTTLLMKRELYAIPVMLAGTLSSNSAVQGDFLNMGTSGKFTDRPTITYSPVTGEKFHKECERFRFR